MIYHSDQSQVSTISNASLIKLTHSDSGDAGVHGQPHLNMDGAVPSAKQES